MNVYGVTEQRGARSRGDKYNHGDQDQGDC